MSEIRYLNTDCLLYSTEDLSPVINELGEQLIVLWNEPMEGKNSIGIEVLIDDPNGPEDHLSRFMELFSSPSILSLLNYCSKKIFDIGFESGDESPMAYELSTGLLTKIAELGFSINIQIYPVSEEPPESEKAIRIRGQV